MTTNADPRFTALTALWLLVQHQGHTDLTGEALRSDLTPAGGPGTSLTRHSWTGMTMLLAVCDSETADEALGSPLEVTSLNIRMAAQMTSRLLPGTSVDTTGRFDVTSSRQYLLDERQDAVEALRRLLADHVAGRSVSPAAVAGTVADLWDAARALTLQAAHDRVRLDGPPPLTFTPPPPRDETVDDELDDELDDDPWTGELVDGEWVEPTARELTEADGTTFVPYPQPTDLSDAPQPDVRYGSCDACDTAGFVPQVHDTVVDRCVDRVLVPLLGVLRGSGVHARNAAAVYEGWVRLVLPWEALARVMLCVRASRPAEVNDPAWEVPAEWDVVMCVRRDRVGPQTPAAGDEVVALLPLPQLTDVVRALELLPRG